MTSGERPLAKPKVSAAAGYVMAGGASTRFGEDKALVRFGGKTMLERTASLLRIVTAEVCVVAAPERYSLSRARVVADRWPGEGPLGGIITALLDAAEGTSRAPWALIVSCDMPFLTKEWLRFLVERACESEADVLIPNSASGLEPLCACWRVGSAPQLEKEFLAGTRKITQALQAMKREVLDEQDWKRFDTAGRLFWNMNTTADYAEIRRVLSEGRP